MKARKPFVAPQLKEQASLAKVTLISGGGQPTFRQNTVHNNSHSHGHGHGHS